SPCATRSDLSYHARLYTADSQRGSGSLESPRLGRGAMTLAQYDGRRAQSSGLSPTQSSQSQTTEKDCRDRGDLCQYGKKDQEATASPTIKRLRIACKATVAIGAVSR